MATQVYLRSTPTAVNLTTTTANKYIAALNTMIAANAANAAYKWKVLAVATSPASLLLSRKDGSAGRITVFGQNGSTPNAAQTRDVTPQAGCVYVGYSPTSVATTVNSYLTATPMLTDADYTFGLLQLMNTTWNVSDARMTYYESNDNLIVDVSSLSVTGNAVFGAGKSIAKDLDTLTDTHGIFANGVNYVMGATWPTAYYMPPVAAFPPDIDSAMNTDAHGQCMVYLSGIWVHMACFNKLATDFTAVLENSATKQWQTTPIILIGPTDRPDLGIWGKLNQIAIGPQCIRETLYQASGPVTDGYGISFHNTIKYSGLWITEFDV